MTARALLEGRSSSGLYISTPDAMAVILVQCLAQRHADMIHKLHQQIPVYAAASTASVASLCGVGSSNACLSI